MTSCNLLAFQFFGLFYRYIFTTEFENYPSVDQ